MQWFSWASQFLGASTFVNNLFLTQWHWRPRVRRHSDFLFLLLIGANHYEIHYWGLESEDIWTFFYNNINFIHIFSLTQYQRMYNIYFQFHPAIFQHSH